MREIKFRAWDKKDKLWVAGWSIGQAGVQTETSNKVFMQYTGLQDKNGKEIFEGDVVKIEDYYENIRIGIIVFDSGTYKLQNLGQNFYYQFGSDGEYDWESIENVDEDNIEIIGNLYENPELLDK